MQIADFLIIKREIIFLAIAISALGYLFAKEKGREERREEGEKRDVRN
ncbi:MAG: hypothetical protein SVO01_07345 [Thermotogota bacterium]|nr:hypothetical protein [Thermotogota bacterium]